MTRDIRPALADLPWRKSTYSNAGNECVEVAQSGPILLIRDSKNPVGARLAIAPSAWRSLTGTVRDKLTPCVRY